VLTKLKSLGPGLLYAGAAIGVSHLVQSTKAGAQYGYVLIIAIVLAHILKYPFFAMGPRYAHHTKTSLVSGYAKIGKWAVLLLLILTLATMFTVQAAVTIVTAGLVDKITGLGLPSFYYAAAMLVICFGILQVGKFNVLENIMKVIMIVLSLSTIWAFAFSFKVDVIQSTVVAPIFSLGTKADLLFLIAFVGWMPAPLDIAVWHSLWSVSDQKSAKRKSLKQINFDFNIGFYGTAVLGICFLMLGANMLYQSGTVLSPKAGDFASQLVDVFTSSLGNWSYWIILIAAFTTMFSTTLTCFDAMPRVMSSIGEQLNWSKSNKSILSWRIILGIGSLIILYFFMETMGQMIRFATTVSFLTAPLLALLSYKLFQKNKKIALWNRFESVLALVGIIALIGFALLYLIQIV
jgi:Mn2+/Fe2+ NRAMP family transporter